MREFIKKIITYAASVNNKQSDLLKNAVKKNCPDVIKRFRDVEAKVSEDIVTIESCIQHGKSVIPEIIFSAEFKKFKDIIREKGTINGCNRCGWLKPKEN